MNANRPKLVEMQKKQRKKTSSLPKPKRKPGAAKMREAADKIVARECKPIVEALATNGKKGQMLSAKFLYNLAESAENSDENSGARKLRSMAVELANSPQWTGEPPKAEMDEDDDGGD